MSETNMSPIGTALQALTSRKGVMIAVPLILVGGLILGFSRSPAVKSTQAVPSPVAVGAPSLPPKAPVQLAQAQQPAAKVGSTFNDGQKAELHAIIKEYLMANPEVIAEVQSALEAKMEKIQADKMATALTENAAEIFRAPTAPVAGNPKGDVTVVEFFDYNCGYCKKAFIDLAAAADKDKQIKLVLKEFPILSKGSEETARVALAAKVQGKYWEFHRAMLESPGQANEASALKVAEKVGLNIAKIKSDMVSPEVKAEIARTRALAQKLGIQGTPHFLVGERSIGGAPDGLSELLIQTAAEVRKAGGCKVC